MSTRSVLQATMASICVSFIALVGCDAGQAGWTRLYNGQDLAGWTARHEAQLGNAWQAAESVDIDPANPKQFVIAPGTGVLVNGPHGRTCDIVSEQAFGDCRLHLEFVVPQGSNSGVYLMGEYEVQILDSYGKPDVTFGDGGGIYARWIDEKNVEGHAPRVNASRPPGEWQSFDIVFRAPRFDAGGKKIENARFISVKHNGVLIHENVSLNGSTRSSLTGQEKPRGPIMLQGDHGPVAFRNIRIEAND